MNVAAADPRCLWRVQARDGFRPCPKHPAPAPKAPEPVDPLIQRAAETRAMGFAPCDCCAMPAAVVVRADPLRIMAYRCSRCLRSTVIGLLAATREVVTIEPLIPRRVSPFVAAGGFYSPNTADVDVRQRAIEDRARAFAKRVQQWVDALVARGENGGRAA